MKTSIWVRMGLGAVLVPALLVQQSAGWGSDGHKLINRLAAQDLPKDVPEFLRSAEAAEAMEMYGPEPDHWRSPAEPELREATAPDHFFDLENADLIGVPLPRKEFDFIRALAFAQKAHPDLALNVERVGLQPYATTELWEKIKNEMREYRELSAAHKNVKPFEAAILFDAGTMGHFVADGSQPLHISIYPNGWTGANPHGYTTEHKIHAQFESEFVRANVDAKRDIVPLIPAKAELLGDVFDQYVMYLRHSNSLVEKTYQLEKAGGLTGAGTAESRAFVDERLAAAVTELRDLIYTAWVRSADPLPEYRNGTKAKADN